MKITSLALVTIGQAPRPDLSALIESAMPPQVKITQVGLLDGISREAVEDQYAVRPGEMPLVTKLRDGAVVSISSERALKTLQLLIDRLLSEGIEAIVLMCTGKFPELRGGPALVIQPAVIVPAVLSALMPGRCMGIILPLQEQIVTEAVKWTDLGFEPLYASASPYSPDTCGLEKAGRKLAASGAQTIVLDCMGYDRRHEEALQKVVDVPVILSNKVIAGVLTSLF